MEYSSKKFTGEQIKDILLYFVSSIDKPVFYVFDTLPDEQWATLAWAYSRTHVWFRQRLLSAIEDDDFSAEEILEAVQAKKEKKNDSKIQTKARNFIQKWVQDYWHNSLKELSHARICIEWVSDLVWKDITWRRLTSPIVKSSRYIDWTAVLDNKNIDKDIASSKYSAIYSETLEYLHTAYIECTEKITKYVEESNKDYLESLLSDTSDEDKEVVENWFRKACKGKSFDASRYLLTASMPTSMALSMNLRTLEYLITRLLSSPLREAQEVGQMLLEEWRNSIFPVFLWEKCHSKRDESLIEIENNLFNFVKNNFSFEKEEKYEITNRVNVEPQRILDDLYMAASIAFKYSNWSFTQIYEELKQNPHFVEEIIDLAFKNKDKFTNTLREIEHNWNITFETLMDYGWYRDVHRHRMGTLTRQNLTTNHGYETPDLVIKSWCLEIFKNAMKKAKETYDLIYKDFPYQAQFIVPFAYRYRTMYSWNPREIQYFIELRSTPQGHESYRWIAQDLHTEISKKLPYFAKYINCNREEVSLWRLKQAISYFKKKRDWKL
jgi:thymidylate synthase ThyX